LSSASMVWPWSWPQWCGRSHKHSADDVRQQNCPKNFTFFWKIFENFLHIFPKNFRYFSMIIILLNKNFKCIIMSKNHSNLSKRVALVDCFNVYLTSLVLVLLSLHCYTNTLTRRKNLAKFLVVSISSE